VGSCPREGGFLPIVETLNFYSRLHQPRPRIFDKEFSKLLPARSPGIDNTGHEFFHKTHASKYANYHITLAKRSSLRERNEPDPTTRSSSRFPCLGAPDS
jgi:hypothetical protein